jgi:hypothetical protein
MFGENAGFRKKFEGFGNLQMGGTGHWPVSSGDSPDDIDGG